MTNLLPLAVRAKAVIDGVTKYAGFVAPLLARIIIGMVFVRTGWGKLHHLDDITSYFTELGIPAPGLNAVVASTTEFVGGLMVTLGIGARFASLPLAFTMLVAMATAKWPKADSWDEIFGWEEASYFVFFVWIALAGAGTASIDYVIRRLLEPRDAAAQAAPASSPAPASAN